MAIASPTPASPATQPPTKRDALTIDVRTDVDWSSDDLAALDAIIDARPHVGMFFTKAWLSGLLADPPLGFEPTILVFRDHGVLCGVIPLGVRHRFNGVRVTLLGGGFRSDRVDLLAGRGYEATLSDMFLAWLGDSFGRTGFVLQLRDVPGDSSIWGAIRRAIDERHVPFTLVPSEIHAMPYLPLDEREIGSPQRRHADAISLGRQWRKLDRRGHLKIEVLQDAEDVPRALDTLADLLRARWGVGTSVLDHPPTLRFHRYVMPLLMAEGRLRVIRIITDMRPVAVAYMLASGPSGHRGDRGATGRWWGYLMAGYDREWAGRIHLGRLLLAAAIDIASREGVREFDFLKGAERYKYFWPVRERVSVDADLYSGSSRTQVVRAKEATRHVAIALVKSVRGLFAGDLPMNKVPS